MKIEQLLGFYRFIYLRQSVWHKRFVLKQSAPWVEDEVLQKYKFCNVYRELDKGSQSIINFVNQQGVSPEDKLFNIIAYRFFNRVESIDKLFRRGLSAESFDLESQITHFDTCHKKGPIFNDAYVISPQTYNTNLRPKDKHVQILCMLNDLRKELPKILAQLEEGTGLELFKNIPMVGSFLAGQMLLDCTYSKNEYAEQDLTPLTANDFLIVGPGAKWGLNILWQKKLTEIEADAACRYLFDHQKEAFDLLKDEGMDFDKVKWQESSYCGQPYLALHDIQNSLCEFRKYHRLSKGENGRKRIFKKAMV